MLASPIKNKEKTAFLIFDDFSHFIYSINDTATKKVGMISLRKIADIIKELGKNATINSTIFITLLSTSKYLIVL